MAKPTAVVEDVHTTNRMTTLSLTAS